MNYSFKCALPDGRTYVKKGISVYWLLCCQDIRDAASKIGQYASDNKIEVKEDFEENGNPKTEMATTYKNMWSDWLKEVDLF